MRYSHFHPHPVKADLDRFTHKGVVQARVTIPRVGHVNALLTHLQEGTSKKAAAARTEQIRLIRRMIDESDFPVIALGDFNVERDTTHLPKGERRRFLRPTPEYTLMKEILSLRDAYLEAHPGSLGLSQNPGRTYLHGPIARKMGIPDTTREQATTIDYILHDANFVATSAVVDEDDFYLDPPDRRIPLSDHRPVHAVLAKMIG